MGRIFAERSVTQMPNDILEDLFYGRLVPWEEVPQDDEVVIDLIHRQAEASAKLDQSLEEADRQLLTQFTDLRSELEMRLYCYYFKKGFCMGAAFTRRTEKSGEKIPDNPA